MVGLAHRVNLRLIYHACVAESQQMHAHPIQLSDSLFHVCIGIGQHARCRAKHVAIQRKAGLHRGLRLQLQKCRRNPFQRNRAKQWRHRGRPPGALQRLE